MKESQFSNFLHNHKIFKRAKTMYLGVWYQWPGFVLRPLQLRFFVLPESEKLATLPSDSKLLATDQAVFKFIT